MYRAADVERVRVLFEKHKVEFMFIGKGAAIIQGFSDTTQDIDIYPMKEAENNRRLVEALRELGVEMDAQVKAAILAGKDFIQFKKPFDLDVVFAPDGFESYEEARRKFKVIHQGFPVLSIEGIIHNKKTAGRVKDRESLYRLKLFKEYLDERKSRS